MYLTINTPSNVVEGQSVKLMFGGGEGPYTVRVLPGNNPGGEPLTEFPATDNTSTEWAVDLPAGTSVGLTVTDATGAMAQSAPFTINA
ncbi:hypothetical protein [Streptomyces griseocarneus]|uniref:hypothetical protein n=1 Tax=Streptomyces griseocarneus TaxID=51201 RepID=UPI00167C4657|nr:hypothetical protein [Streptomyces griseocarneus]MBZ6476223.1 hypothetical protein [Streptomyces griseocarneus]GHG63278.1 hypothetical protein GCM10018779_32730 [Streptomyces griseocarneus]